MVLSLFPNVGIQASLRIQAGGNCKVIPSHGSLLGLCCLDRLICTARKSESLIIWTTLAPKLTFFGTGGCNANHINARHEPRLEDKCGVGYRALATRPSETELVYHGGVSGLACQVVPSSSYKASTLSRRRGCKPFEKADRNTCTPLRNTSSMSGS